MILALETAIDGGSLAIREGNTEIDSWSGASEISKAEDVLQGLSDLIKRNGIDTKKISLIAVSTAAGSATGLKIGLATAKGLSKAFACPVRQISIWSALAGFIPKRLDAAVDVFLPAGKNRFYRRELSGEIFSGEVQIISKEQLQLILSAEGRRDSYAHRRIIQSSDSRPTNVANTSAVKDLGYDLAKYIAEYASDNE